MATCVQQHSEIKNWTPKNQKWYSISIWDTDMKNKKLGITLAYCSRGQSGYGPTNKIRRYIVTSSLIIWAYTQNDPCEETGTFAPKPSMFVCKTLCKCMHCWNLTPYFSTWWRHQMEPFSALLAICAGHLSVPGEFPAQRPVARGFDVFFDLRLNKRLRKQSWGRWFETLSPPLWRHCYDTPETFSGTRHSTAVTSHERNGVSNYLNSTVGSICGG